MRLIKLTRTHWAMHGLLAAALVTAPGCGSGDFLGLEDYQRDLITGGLLAAALLNRPAANDVPGEAGVDGRDGDPGISCWDTNGDRVADPEEDVNGDGNYNTLDCVGPVGADGAAGGADGDTGLSCWDVNGDSVGDDVEDTNGDGNFDALDCKGPTGPPGADGSDGSDGADGEDGADGANGADGMTQFSIFVDDFFAAVGTPQGDLPVQTVSVTEPVLGMMPNVAGEVTTAAAYRVVIPQIYDEGNDVTMRIFFHRTGPYRGDCFIFRIDGKRLRNGSTIEDYGTPRWVRVETPEAVPAGLVAGDPVDLEIEALLVIDLPLNTIAGLGFPSLAVSDFLAFQLSTERGDGGAYHLVGVEFTESRSGTATRSGSQVFTSQDELSCDFIDCDENGVPDSTDIARGDGADCNSNGTLDSCDLRDGFSSDCQPNDIPDECEEDCNSNGVPDDCDIGNPQFAQMGPGGLLFPLDGSYQLVDFFGDGCTGSGCAEGPDQHNDDDSATVPLPFSFDLYGTQFTSTFINNNGNVSFQQPFSTFTAEGFPVASFPMVAPFWGDVDTGNPSNQVGDVWMRFFDGSDNGSDDTLVVTWQDVGYYDERGDLRNTFQLAMSDGTNPAMGLGNNVCFSYERMEWTTGEASEGVDGFGGVPATVGANAGDGTTFFQIGRFDHAGTDYDGPGGNSDGVGYLVGQQICLNASTSTFNINPIPSNFPPGNIVTVLATQGGTLDLDLQFLSPELDQTTTVTHAVVTVQGSGPVGLTVEHTPGTVAHSHLIYSPDCTQVGTYDVMFTATDDFDPPGVTDATLRIVVTCETVDCNSNGVPDECDIDDGTSEDCNSNGIPDECDGGCEFVDCNSNGTPDEIDIADQTSGDCNSNGIPDECDIDDGTSVDCQPNGIPDECDVAGAGTTAVQGDGGGKVYWTDYLNNKIQQSDLDGANFTDLVTTGLNQASGIALDVDGGKMYWVDQIGIIKRANLDGSNVETVLDSVARPIGIALDVAGGKMYWTESAHPVRKIQRANLDGSNVEDLISTTSLGLDSPWGIALDLPHGKLYWTDTGGFIMRADLDGSNVERLVRSNTPDFWPTGIAVDSAGGKIYWTEDYYNKIQSANLEIPEGEADWNRTDIEDLVINVNLPGEIALDVAVHKMYWVDYYSGTIKRADMDGSNVETVFYVGRSILLGIALELPPILPPDCNSNGVPDSCDVRDGTSEDCNSNGIPDECDGGCEFVDCNSNGTPDEIDIAEETSADCNGNTVPDECDIASGTSEDCNSNAVPDECDIDDGTSEDCQSNNIPDMCDIRDGTSNDNDSNGIPDECAPAAFFGPIPYLMVRHSPWGYTDLGPDFYWERFESGALTTPGVTISVPGFVRPPSLRTDSVDADDGLLDGRGQGGHSYWYGGSDPNVTIKFTFDEATLGFLPTHAGIVWTDGTGTITFEAFDASGASLGTVTGNHAGAGDSGQTDEDRFYGIVDSGGISAISISNVGVQMEVDHLMYGIPSPPN